MSSAKWQQEDLVTSLELQLVHDDRRSFGILDKKPVDGLLTKIKQNSARCFTKIIIVACKSKLHMGNNNRPVSNEKIWLQKTRWNWKFRHRPAAWL